MESHGKLFLVYKITNLGRFSCQLKRTQAEMRIFFWKISRKMVRFRSWKTLKIHGKGHGKSWNFKSAKEYEPWTNCSQCCELRVWQYFHCLKSIDRHNKANLDAVEKAIFVLCLDKTPPYSTQSPSVMEMPTSSVTARQCLHGDGTDYNSANRWFDKIIQVHL